MLPLSWAETKLPNGSPSSCLMPSEMRSRSTSMDSTTVSTSSPFLRDFTASSPVAFHERSDEHTSELQSPDHLVCRLLLEKKIKTPLTLSAFMLCKWVTSH